MYEGGAVDAGGQENKSNNTKSNKSKSSKKSKYDGEDHCCCTYTTALYIYGGLLLFLGFFIVINILLILDNMYMPMYYKFVSLLLAIVVLASLILITIWVCKDSYYTRQCLRIGGWILLAASVIIIIWNIFFIYAHTKGTKNDKIMVGTGDDPDNYSEKTKGGYMLGYILWGIVIITINILFLCVADGYANAR